MLPSLQKLIDYQKEDGCPYFRELLEAHQKELGQIAGLLLSDSSDALGIDADGIRPSAILKASVQEPRG